ncbi:hypothetical protein F5B19DRAFT_106326 [Rostrohypoxylon terebratum]|nr:hypothetical protein F5B19DRAFT_106326 [Rostrohypoxylon terebratum]
MGLIASLTLQIYFQLRKEKREKKEKEEKERQEKEKATADFERGQPDSSTTAIEEQGLAAKPELEGTMVGVVVPKMELDSQPIAELASTSHVQELDCSPSPSPSAYGSQVSPNSANTPRSADQILPVSTKPHDIAYELPG